MKRVIFVLGMFFCSLKIFSQGLVPYLKNNGKYTYYDIKNNTLNNNYNFDNAYHFINDLAVVELNGTKGIIKIDKIILPIEYDLIGEIDKKYIFVGKGDYHEKFKYLADGEGGFIDRQGNFIHELNPAFRESASFDGETTFLSNSEGKCGIIDKHGNILVNFLYERIYPLPNEQYMVQLDGKFGIINKSGKILLPLFYNWYISTSGDNLFCVQKGNKSGVVDSSNNIIVPFKYDIVESFHEGLAATELKGKWGYINKLGITIIPFKYDFAGNFNEGMANVTVKGKQGCITKKGILTVPYKYYQIYHQNKYYAIVANDLNPEIPFKRFFDGVYGIVNTNTGKLLLPLKFDMIEYCDNNLFRLFYKGHSWYYDIKNNRNYTDFNFF
jgi:hypothetical protein